ncbi:MAG: hypothetical protein ABGW84_07560 [Sphingomonadaceae bacterium]
MVKFILSALVLVVAGYAWVETYTWLETEHHKASMLFFSFAATCYAMCSHRHAAVVGGGSKTEEANHGGVH